MEGIVGSPVVEVMTQASHNHRENFHLGQNLLKPSGLGKRENGNSHCPGQGGWIRFVCPAIISSVFIPTSLKEMINCHPLRW